jgi:hypothetical protein
MIHFLLYRLSGFSRCDNGLYQPRIDRDRSICFLATLTCHFFHLLFPALNVGSLAIGVIEPCRAARLAFAVGFAALD